MAGNPDFTALLATTISDYQDDLADNVSNNNALLSILNAKDRIELVDGGNDLVCPLMYDANETFMYYSGAQQLNIASADELTAARYLWKNASISVTITGSERRRNSGKHALSNLLTGKMQVAEKTLKNNISTGVYSNGSGSGGKQIDGLQKLVADAPTSGSVGGISRDTETWWQNQFDDDEIQDSTAALGLMNQMWLSLVRGMEAPTLIVADSLAYTGFWGALQDIQRITSAEGPARSGFRSLEFAGPSGFAPVYFDGACPTKHMYFLNDQYLTWKVHPEANFAPREKVVSMNQDAESVLILFEGNLTMNNAEMQGVIFDGD